MFIWLLISIACQIHAETDRLQERFDQILDAKELKHAAISCSVFNTKSNDLVLGINQDMSLIPASSLKLITTLSALNVLGDDFIFTTRISYQGEILSDGTLDGDVYVEGSGDPSLGTTDFKSTISFVALLKDIVKAIQKAGINCIEGDIIADESIFNSFPVNPTWQWNDLGNYYASGAWGINVLENQYQVYFQQTNKIGATPQIHHYFPEIPGLELQNEIETDSVGTGDNAYIFGGPYNYKKRIVGTIPAGNELFMIKGSIPDPPLFFVYHLQKELIKKGIQSNNIQTHYTQKHKKGRKKLVEIDSPKLIDLSRKANFESNNLYCESLLKRLGFEEKGEGSGEIGKRVIKKFFRANDIPTEGLHLVDGSGLSARNLMSSYVMVLFLDRMLDKMGFKKLRSLIPKTGAQGTVRGLLKGKKAAGHVWAKSGSMERVLSYSGLIKSKNGSILSFCFIINGHSIKNSKLSHLMQELMNSVYELG
jgi:D-alanyl-D-alanine carboxypeptidase/D-alanyl-D-alanine-endopeptidase (penicillin-binding protein 4)